MADIFISYAHQDVERAKAIAMALEAHGWSVWWDPDIRSGESFVSVINREITAASCVVVLWSKASVVSRWVIEEALNGLHRDILCPIVIDRGVQLPVGFATIKYLPLWQWRNGVPSGGYNVLFSELVRSLGMPTPSPVAVEQVTREPEPAPSAPHPPPIPERAPEEAPAPTVPSPDRHAPASPQPRIAATAAQVRFIDFSDLSWIDYPVIALFFAAIAMYLASFTLRFFFKNPSSIADELAVMGCVIAALFGAAIALRNGRSIQSPISLLVLRGQPANRLAPIQALVSSGVFLVLTVMLISETLRLARYQLKSSFTDLPLTPGYIAIAGAFAAMALFSLKPILKLVIRKARK